MELNALTGLIIGCAIEIHSELGPGMLESSYETCLQYELTNKGLKVKRQMGLPLVYKELFLEHGYRLDLLVEDRVIVEVKSTESISDIHIAQCLTYLQLSKAEIGLILNFNVLKMTTGIKRVIPRTPR